MSGGWWWWIDKGDDKSPGETRAQNGRSDSTVSFFSCQALAEMLPMKTQGAGTEDTVADIEGGQP